MEPSHPRSRVQRVRYDLRRREVSVARVQTLGPDFVRILFFGEALVDFVSQGFDDHIKFMFDAGDGELVARDYTPRAFDPARRELTIDFAIHGHGPASEWARNADVGHRALIGGPRGSMIIPADYDWHLLAGDATAVPAISRRLEDLPPQAKVIVILQLADDTPLKQVPDMFRAALLRVATPDELVAGIRALQLPPGGGYAWCAGEATTMAQVRAILIDEKAHPRDAMRVAAYWKGGASAFHEDSAQESGKTRSSSAG